MHRHPLFSSNGPETVRSYCVFSNESNTKYRVQNINFVSASRISVARQTFARLGQLQSSSDAARHTCHGAGMQSLMNFGCTETPATRKCGSCTLFIQFVRPHRRSIRSIQHSMAGHECEWVYSTDFRQTKSDNSIFEWPAFTFRFVVHWSERSATTYIRFILVSYSVFECAREHCEKERDAPFENQKERPTNSENIFIATLKLNSIQR